VGEETYGEGAAGGRRGWAGAVATGLAMWCNTVTTIAHAA